MNKVKKYTGLSTGVFLCLVGSISISEFLYHFDVEVLFDLEYFDFYLLFQLIFYAAFSVIGVFVGVPLVYENVQSLKIGTESGESGT